MAFKERPSDLEFEAGSGGLWSTMGDYLKFARIFVENGSPDGIQIVKKETLDLMCSNHLTPTQRQQSKLMGTAMFRDNFGFGLGVAVVMTESPYLIHALCRFYWHCRLARCIWWLVVSRSGKKIRCHLFNT